MKTYNWVTLGYGVIAHQLADAMQQEGRTLYGVAISPDGFISKIPACSSTPLGAIFTCDTILSGEMATIALTLHAKQPKRGTLAFDKGYIEIYEYPRAEKAVITYTEDQHREIISTGQTKHALRYEVLDMEKAVSGQKNEMHLDYTTDVMSMMTEIRKSWGLFYPEEQEK